jgi:multiple sugar transport system permease protein
MWGCNFVPQICLSLLCAAWFTDKRLRVPGQGVFKILIFLPNVLTASSIAILFTSLFDKTGVVNVFLMNQLHVTTEPYDFLRSTGWTRGLVSFIQTWMWYGNTMISLISGILGINESLFEASEIDGCTSTQTFFKVTIPCIQPIMVYTLVTSIIGGLQLYDVPKLLSSDQQGAPNYTAQTVTMYITKKAFTDNNYGKAGAAATMLFVATAILSCIVFYILRDKDEAAKKKYIKQQRKLAKQGKSVSGGLQI